MGPRRLLAALASSTSAGEGTQTLDPDRKTDLCQWRSTDPIVVVAVGLTDEPAQAAFDLNKELAPAYFEGEAVDTAVPGADAAYLVLGDSGQLVIGAVVGDRYVSIQLAGDGMAEDDVRALAGTVVERLA